MKEIASAGEDEYFMEVGEITSGYGTTMNKSFQTISAGITEGSSVTYHFRLNIGDPVTFVASALTGSTYIMVSSP